MTDKQLIKRIINLALRIKETDQLTKVADEIKQMELEKMFTTKEGKYYRLAPNGKQDRAMYVV